MPFVFSGWLNTTKIKVANEDDDNVIKVLPCPYSALSSSNRINFNRN